MNVQQSRPERPRLAGESFDVLVIGGGINGVAIARECAWGGRKVALVEQHDFASGTTSRSTRMIHGGLRYLEHGELGLVRESLRERERLLRRHPNLVKPLQFLLAISKEHRTLLRSSLAIRTGLWLYHRWAGAPSNISADPHLFERRLDGGHAWAVYSYEDAQCEFPERLVAEWLIEAQEKGVTTCNYTQALEILRQHGQVTGVRVRDTLSGAEFRLHARQIVNAAGPWADFVLSASGIESGRLVGGVRGSHLVLPQFSGAPSAVLYAEATDGRPFFVVPWNQQVLVGTTEVTDSSDPSTTQPEEGEIDYLLAGFARLFPKSGLTKVDIRYSFAGIRSLPFSPDKSMSAVTRKHIIHDHQPEGAAGLFTIVGGKLTTAMSLAREVARKLGLAAPEPVNILAAPEPASGIESTLKQWSHLVACKADIPESCAQAIAGWHGRRALAIACTASLHKNLREPLCPHTEHIVAEAIEAVLHESAVTLGDMLLRRVPVALGPCWSEACSLEAASRIGSALGWEQAKIHREFEQFEEERREFLHPVNASVVS